MVYYLHTLGDVQAFDDKLWTENRTIEAREEDPGATAFSFAKAGWKRYDYARNCWTAIADSDVPQLVREKQG